MGQSQNTPSKTWPTFQRSGIEVPLHAQATAASGFIEVFSQYAFAAGVTSQADSPLPGPADAAAIGILVVGLVDAGLLEGALLVSLGELVSDITPSTTLAPPVAKTLSMATATPTATAAPTVDVPPVAITRRNPGQTCEDAELDELERQKNSVCKGLQNCGPQAENLGKKNEKLLTCPELLFRILKNKACLDARKLVQTECFKGSPHKGHETQIQDVTNALNKCIQKAAIRGPGGGPC